MDRTKDTLQDMDEADTGAENKIISTNIQSLEALRGALPNFEQEENWVRSPI